MASKNSLGSRVTFTRKNIGMSQAQLAKKLRVSATAVWNWEQNGVQPRPAMLAALAKVLGVTEAYLLTGQGGDGSPPRTAAQIIQTAAQEIAALNGVAVNRVKIEWKIV